MNVAHATFESVPPAALSLRGLTRVYGGPTGHPALAGVDLDVSAGEYLAIVGPSGSGKSTLLRLVAGLDTPTAGTIRLAGREAAGLAPRDRGVAMVFQNPAVYPHLSVADNLAFGLRARGVEARQVRARVDEVAGWLGLDGLLGRRPHALSGGQRQRVALGRAIATRPALFLLDEPLASLDAPLRVEIQGILADLRRRTEATFVHVTHDQAEALALADRVGVLRDGRLVQVDTPRAVVARPADRFVAQFFGSPAFQTIEVEVRHDASGTHLVLADAGAEPLPPGCWPTGAVVLGVRPDDLMLRPDDTLADNLLRLPGGFTVDRVQYLGRTTMVGLRRGPHRLAALVASPCGWAPGVSVRLGCPVERVHWFEATTGAALEVGREPVADPGIGG